MFTSHSPPPPKKTGQQICAKCSEGIKAHLRSGNVGLRVSVTGKDSQAWKEGVSTIDGEAEVEDSGGVKLTLTPARTLPDSLGG